MSSFRGTTASIGVDVAVLLHVAGDVAIMVTNGWSTFKVAIFQLLSGATAFIGLYIGITITQYLVEAQEWIFIVAAAMFLYVALADVVRFTLLFDKHVIIIIIIIIIMMMIIIITSCRREAATICPRPGLQVSNSEFI